MVHGTARKQVVSCPGRSHAGITSSAHPSTRQGRSGLGSPSALPTIFWWRPWLNQLCDLMRSLVHTVALHLSITLAVEWCGRRPHSWRSTLLARWARS